VGTNLNWNIYPGSRISRLPQNFQRPALAIRNLLSILNRRSQKHGFRHLFDGLGTIHDMHFLGDERFIEAQNRAIKAAGYDYSIPLRLHQALWCAELGYKIDADAIFVELGTGRGYVMSAICEFLSKKSKEFDAQKIYLFDTFVPYRLNENGLPDEELGINPHYTETFEKVIENFSEWKNVSIVRGSLPETLGVIRNTKISFLHIDLNAPRVEIESLLILWDQILPGAPILIDDYAYSGYFDTLVAFNNIASTLDLSILTTASGQGITFKPSKGL
jgi:hypothetical protein